MKYAADHLNSELNAIVEIFDDVIENPLKDGLNSSGKFAALSLFMKDLGPTIKRRLQEMGYLMMAGNRPVIDSFLTGKLRHAGLNIIGRTTTPEFGLCSFVENPDLYITRNPWNTNYTICGSSAGLATAVASSIIPIPHATEGVAQLENGLQFGMHFMVKQEDDGLLLQLGAQIDRTLKGKWNKGDIPSIHVTKINEVLNS